MRWHTTIGFMIFQTKPISRIQEPELLYGSTSIQTGMGWFNTFGRMEGAGSSNP
jgi:hypothetical protein